MSTTLLQPALARLTAAEKLKLVGDLWDEIAVSGAELPLSNAQKAELRAEREAIRRNPRAGASWPVVRARIQRKK